MTRIIAGEAGRVLLAVPRTGTRPTSDRVREALFSALESRDAIDGARVLDLYAGSGALGLEAASRGASAVVLVEKSGQAAAICRRNAAAVTASIGADAPAVEVRASAVLPYLGSASGSFELVFSDPPYELAEPELTADLAALVRILADDALVVVERATRSPEPSWPEGLSPERPKRYGETTIWFATRV